MRHIDIKTCAWLSQEWSSLIRDGYETAMVSDDRVAVMWRGAAGRDYVRNVMPGRVQLTMELGDLP